MVLTPAELGRGAKDCGVRRGLRELQHDETCTDGMKTESPMGETLRVRASRHVAASQRQTPSYMQLQKVDMHHTFHVEQDARPRVYLHGGRDGQTGSRQF